MNMSNLKKKKRATARTNVCVGEVEKVWGTPISQEAKEWTSRHLEAKLRMLKNHDVRLTQAAAVEVAKRDRRVERYVDKRGLQMRAADMAWAWVAHKAMEGQAVGKVFRPEHGPLDEEHVLWDLVAMASTGLNADVRERVTRETLQRVVLSRQVLKRVQGDGQGQGNAEWGVGGAATGHGPRASRDDTEADLDGVAEFEQVGRAEAGQRSGEGEVLGMHAHAHAGGSHRGECGEAPSRQA